MKDQTEGEDLLQMLDLLEKVPNSKLSVKKLNEVNDTRKYMQLLESTILRRYEDLVVNFKAVQKRVMRTDLKLKNAERSDVLFKTIAREIRKVYLRGFGKESKYLRVQRYKDYQSFYLTSILKFVREEKIVQDFFFG